jgi:hypothetical protein
MKERKDEMIAGSMRLGIERRVPLATFVARIGDYARALMDTPEHRLEFLLTDHDGTVAQVALATHRFHAYLAVTEQRRRVADPGDAERYNNDALRQAQIVIVEPGDAVVLLDPAPALVLLPPDLYTELRRELLDGLSLARENDPAFVERIVNARHEEG